MNYAYVAVIVLGILSTLPDFFIPTRFLNVHAVLQHKGFVTSSNNFQDVMLKRDIKEGY